MSRAKMAITLVLIVVIAVSPFVYLSVTKSFWFTHALTLQNVGVPSSASEPEFEFNLSDSGRNVGEFYFRVEPIFPNQTSNKVYIDFQHSGNTELDSIDFRFSSPEVTKVYLDMSDRVGVEYISSISADSFSINANNFGELGTMQGSNGPFQFVLFDRQVNSNSLYFSADISMHYMSPLQLTTLKAHITINTAIPSD